MSKKWDREERELDRLQKEVRELKSENKMLRRKLKTLSRGYYKFLYQDSEQEAVNNAKEVAKKICFDCNIGSLDLLIIGPKYFRMCKECGKRTKAKDISQLSPEERKE